MSHMFASHIVIAGPQPVADKLKGILASAQIEPQAFCLSGEEAIAAAGEARALVLTTYRLPDMTGEEMAARLPNADLLMIAPQDYVCEPPCENVLLLHNPMTQEALVQAVRTMIFAQGRMHPLEEKTQRLSRMLEERRVIEKAKGRLMEERKMSEADAHHYLQKTSMDAGRRMIDVAQEILSAQTLTFEA